MRSYDIELTRSFFSKKFCCLTKKMVENILGNFCKTNFEIFEQNRAAILRENWKIGRAKTPKCSTPFFCQGTKFRAETTSVSEISVAMQQDALLSFWSTYMACSLLDSVRVKNPQQLMIYSHLRTWILIKSKIIASALVE